jgi:hypothetical protein
VVAISLLALLTAAPLDVHASIPLTQTDGRTRQKQALSQLGVQLRADRGGDSGKQEEPVGVQVKKVMELMEAGEKARAEGDYNQVSPTVRGPHYSLLSRLDVAHFPHLLSFKPRRAHHPSYAGIASIH